MRKVIAVSAILLGANACSTDPIGVALSNQTATTSSSQDAYAYCGQILAGGIYDTKSYLKDLSARKMLVDWNCSTMSTWGSEDNYIWGNECKFSSSTDQTATSAAHGGSMDMTILGIPIGVNFNYGDSGSDGHTDRWNDQWCATTETRRSHRQAWYNAMCRNRNEDDSTVESEHYLVSNADSAIVDAWKSCVQQKNFGVACYGTNHGNGTIYFDVGYNKADFGADLSLTWASSNLDHDVFATELKGGDVGVFLTVVKPALPAHITVVASGGDHQITCPYYIAPKIEESECRQGKAFGKHSGDAMVDLDRFCSRWWTAGSMKTPRNNHTATLLGNGKVLVAGGVGPTGPLSSVELYDPANVANPWSDAAPMHTARSTHTATLLPNGKVLVAGGAGISSVLSNAELYDPAMDTWSDAGPMPTARYAHTATPLGNGKVLVAGGVGTGGIVFNAELYDAANVANPWSAAGSMTIDRRNHTATLLGNGKVLVSGGSAASGALLSAELYDPAQDAAHAWSAAASMATARSDHTATLLGNGKVLVAGGAGSSDTELYDATANAWSVTSSMSTPRSTQTATLLADGEVLVAGGAGGGGALLSSAELYDPAARTWSDPFLMSTARVNHTTTLLEDGKILIAGGDGISGRLSSAELFSPVDNRTP